LLLDFPIVLRVDELKREPWHALEPDAVLERLEARPSGLDDEEAARRRSEVGPNELPKREPPSIFRIILRQFTDPLIYILLVAAIVSFAIGSFNNGAFITAVLVLNTVIGTIQERKAESSARALEQLVSVSALVERDGSRRELDAKEIVPGDVILVESGDAVPADARLLESRELRCDESLLTGESEAVSKDADADIGEDASVGDRDTMIHAGTSVVAGRARAVVCRTGGHTQVGDIAASLAEGESAQPPLVLRLKKLTRLIAVVVLVAIAILAVLQLAQGTEWTRVFFLAVALAVSAIPAGLPVAITVALSIASTRMAKRNVIVRRLPAVEGLGACTLIASDKTGTLTENVLTARVIGLPDGRRVDVAGRGYAVEGGLEDEALDDETKERALAVAECGAITTDASWPDESEAGEDGEDRAPRGDAVDSAFLVLGDKLGFESARVGEGRELVAEIPYESDRRFSAKFHREADVVRAYVKGATDTLLPMCGGVDADEVKAFEERLADEGFRVLATAAGEVSGDVTGEESSDELAARLENLELLGLVGLIDPVRREVPDAVKRCRSAGVDVRMITGDHPGTGLAIARDLGLFEGNAEDGAVLGRELGDDDESGDVARRVEHAPVFARVEPSQKTRIVDALQRLGHFVAVTGDGANDAPALRKANIGVAMGEGGTDVARGAADLILTDDNFASIVNGIEEGRIAYDNVRRVTWLLLATGAGEVILFFLALGFGMPLPLVPIQLLWLNLVTNGIQDVALAFEKGDGAELDRPPRDPDEPIFDKRMVEHVLTSGAYIGLLAFGVFWYVGEVLDQPLAVQRNVALLLVVLLENVHIFSCRSERRSAFSVPIRANWLLVGAVLVAHGVHILSMYIPGWRDLLGIQPVELTTWLTLLPIALTLLVFDEVVKWMGRRAEARGHSNA
jgi:magnesium-transporting ATPase (P-type)